MGVKKQRFNELNTYSDLCSLFTAPDFLVERRDWWGDWWRRRFADFEWLADLERRLCYALLQGRCFEALCERRWDVLRDLRRRDTLLDRRPFLCSRRDWVRWGCRVVAPDAKLYLYTTCSAMTVNRSLRRTRWRWRVCADLVCACRVAPFDTWQGWLRLQCPVWPSRSGVDWVSWWRAVKCQPPFPLCELEPWPESPPSGHVLRRWGRPKTRRARPQVSLLETEERKQKWVCAVELDAHWPTGIRKGLEILLWKEMHPGTVTFDVRAKNRTSAGSYEANFDNPWMLLATGNEYETYICFWCSW